MASPQLNPNRFARGPEAIAVLARVAIEQADVDVASRRDEHAQVALKAADARFLEAQATYNICQAARDEAITYSSTARQCLDASLKRLAAAKAPLHPVRKAPLEVLGLIFEDCLEHFTLARFLSRRPQDIRARQLQPFHLASVCQIWRRAALSSPRVWAVIELILECERHHRADAWREYFRLIVSRSGSAALHVRLYRMPLSPGIDENLIAIVSAEMHRCFTLTVALESIEDTDDPVLPLLCASTPTLRELYIFINSLPTDISAVQLLPWTPELRSVYAKVPFYATTFNFDAVTLARLHEATFSEARCDLDDLLVMAPTVSELQLHRPRINGESRGQTFASSVASLIITYDVNDHLLPEVARCFAFPALKRLHLQGSPNASLTRMEYLAATAHDSPSLCYIVLHQLDAAGIDRLVRALSACAQVERLEIWNTHFCHSSFRTLCRAFEAANDDGDWLCPALRMLQLSRCTFPETCDQTLLARCAQRRNQASQDDNDERRPVRLTHVHIRGTLDTSFI